MSNELKKRAWDGWKDLHTWSRDDRFHWALPETILQEDVKTKDLPSVLERGEFDLPSMMLVTAVVNAIGKDIEIEKTLKNYADEQIALALSSETSHPSELAASREWLWNLRQLGAKGIPDDFGERDLTDLEVYEFRSALQNAGVHPLKFFDGRAFAKILRGYSPESIEPHDLMAKFYEREAFIDALLFEPALENIALNDPLIVTVRETNDALCRAIGRDLPVNNRGVRSRPEDKVTLRFQGEEEGKIEVTPPDQVESALKQLEEINAKWQLLSTEEKLSTAKNHFIKMWAGITTVQPLAHQNNRTGFIVAHQLTRKYTNRQLPFGAFTGGLSVKGEKELYDQRDPVTLSPVDEVLTKVADKINTKEWVNQSLFAESIRANGFISRRPWLDKLKWRT